MIATLTGDWLQDAIDGARVRLADRRERLPECLCGARVGQAGGSCLSCVEIRSAEAVG